ncbi:hypothetical protein BDR04DRAFT_790421 [Suillus decipiens]|nr:hypothetical protein BDR04DRAFT_790421 [Suillus decipiens]
MHAIIVTNQGYSHTMSVSNTCDFLIKGSTILHHTRLVVRIKINKRELVSIVALSFFCLITTCGFCIRDKRVSAWLWAVLLRHSHLISQTQIVDELISILPFFFLMRQGNLDLSDRASESCQLIIVSCVK